MAYTRERYGGAVTEKIYLNRVASVSYTHLSDLDRVTLPSDTLRKYFPKSYTPQRMQETIIKLLEPVSYTHLYLEYRNRKVRLVTLAGEFWLRESIGAMEKRLAPYGCLLYTSPPVTGILRISHFPPLPEILILSIWIS